MRMVCHCLWACEVSRGGTDPMEPAMPEAAAISTMGYTTQPAAYTMDPGAYTMGTIQGAPLEGRANTRLPCQPFGALGL